MKVILALPAYNEAEALPALLESFRGTMTHAGFAHHVVIADDGSRDRTAEVIKEWSLVMPVLLVEHAQNLGLGDTIRDALRAAADLAEPADIIVTMDADNTHSPSLIPGMVKLIAEGTDVAIASRYRKGARVIGLSAYREWLSIGARVLFQVVLPIPGVRDYTCSFRAHRVQVIREAFARYGEAFVTERSFACMAEIIVRLSRMNVKFAEVPMVLRYDQKAGASKMAVARTIIKTLQLLARLRFQG